MLRYPVVEVLRLIYWRPKYCFGTNSIHNESEMFFPPTLESVKRMNLIIFLGFLLFFRGYCHAGKHSSSREFRIVDKSNRCTYILQIVNKILSN